MARRRSQLLSVLSVIIVALVAGATAEPVSGQRTVVTHTFELPADATVTNDQWQTNHGRAGQLGVGTWDERGQHVERSFIRFNLSAIPRGAEIHSAQLKLILEDGFGDERERQVIEVRRVSESWGEREITWRNQPRSASPSGRVEVDLNHDKHTWNVVRFVQGWVDGDYPNHGMVLVSASEQKVAWRRFESCQNARCEVSDCIAGPKLVVTWAQDAVPTATAEPTAVPTATSPTIATPTARPTATDEPDLRLVLPLLLKRARP